MPQRPWRYSYSGAVRSRGRWGFCPQSQPDLAYLKYEVVAPSLPAWVEDRHIDESLGISKRQSHVLGSIAVTACQDKVVDVAASTASAWHQVLHLERAVEELLRSEAVLTLVVRATGDFLVLPRGHARDGGQR